MENINSESMLFIRNVYLILLPLISIALICAFSVCVYKKTKVSLNFAKLLVPLILILVCEGLIYFVEQYQLAIFIRSLYYILFFILLFRFICFENSWNEFHVQRRITKKMYIVLGVFFLIDVVLLFMNLKKDTSLILFRIYIGDNFFSWGERILPLFLYHLVLCYLIAVFIISGFIKTALVSPSVYRYKFILILILFTTCIVLNFISRLYGRIWGWGSDYTTIIYGIIGLIIFQFVFYRQPHLFEENMLTVITDSISDAVVCFDSNGMIAFKNQMAEKLFFSSKNISTLSQYVKKSEEKINATEILELDGTPHVFRVEYRKLRDKSEKLEGSFIKLSDCTNEVKKLTDEEYRAAHDELTGLLNRKSFFEKMRSILDASPDVPRYLACWDIKDFKLVNDLFGVKFGDHVLQEIALLLLSGEYPGSICGRISGDKFALLIDKDKFNFEVAQRHAEKIHSLAKDVNFMLHIYIGVYEISNSYEKEYSIYDKANLAIQEIYGDYNRVISVYDTSLLQKLIYEKDIITAFRRSLEKNYFMMFLQPQIDVKTEKCIGAEALVRWGNEFSEVKKPDEFIHILEKSGLIYELDKFIWEEAVKKLVDWKNRGINFHISINISPIDFYYMNVYKELTYLVEKYKVGPEKLNLEITETIFIGKKKNHEEILSNLRSYGFKIEMDDFGSGYSSLATLRDISIDVLKIDMEFLHKTANEEKGRFILASVIKMAKSLGLGVIAEGIESKFHAEMLRKLGCDVFQGFYYSRPISVQDFEAKYLGGKV